MLFPSAHLKSPAQVSVVCIAFFSRNPLRFFLANSNQSADPHIRAAWISFKLLVSIHQPVLLSMNARRGFMFFFIVGFYDFHGDIQKDVVFQVKQIEAEKSLDPGFFFRLLLHSGRVKHGEQEIRDFQKKT